MPVSSALVTIAPQAGVAMRLHRGAVLTIVDLQGEQVADLALFSAEDLDDSFSPGRTIDYNHSIRIARGDRLYSNGSTELARVVQDSVGVHDLLLAPCSREMFASRGEFAHASCHANLAAALGEFGIRPAMVTATLNVFMDVRIGPGGSISLHPPASKAGDSFAISALRELVVGLTACASEKTNAGLCKPIAYAIQNGED